MTIPRVRRAYQPSTTERRKRRAMLLWVVKVLRVRGRPVMGHSAWRASSYQAMRFR
jgi:hypothetical protein